MYYSVSADGHANEGGTKRVNKVKYHGVYIKIHIICLEYIICLDYKSNAL